MFKTLAKDFRKHKFLFLLVAPGIIYFIIFCYIPMFGITIAFQDYRITRGFFQNDWVGLKNFIEFFGSPSAYRIIKNTLLLNIYSLLWGFPLPIIFAIMLSELKNNTYRKIIQTVSYLPYFISTVIAVGIVYMLIGVNSGIINIILENIFGMEKINFLIEPRYFRTIYVATNLWKNFGWSSVIFIAAIVGIDAELYEASIVDGASRLKRIIHITIPCISNTIIVMLLLNIGSLMSIGFEMVYLLYTPATYDVSDVISTYVYRMGIASSKGLPKYSYTTAVGLFQSIVNMILLVVSNKMAKRWSDTSLY